MHANEQGISEVFSIFKILEIPFFQRSYVWGIENWERFLEDMVNTSNGNKEYFLGSLILKHKDTSSGDKNGNVRTIVDGQQRLTTLAIFLKQLYAIHGDSETFDKLLKIRGKKDGTPIIKHNHYDQEPFDAVLCDKKIEEISEEKKKGQIISCYRYFKNNEQVLKGMDPEKIFNNIYFVVIDLSSNEDEQEIFDTINSLGVSLTTAELLKNYLFPNENYKEPFNETWGKTFEVGKANTEYWSYRVTAGREKRENIDLLLQSFLTIQSDKTSKYTKTASIFNKYKEFIKSKGEETEGGVEEYKKNLTSVLMKTAEYYKNNFNPDVIKKRLDGKVDRINLIIFGLNVSTVIPYILYIVENVTDDNKKDELISLVENYLVRRIVCGTKNNSYANNFSALAQSRTIDYGKLRDYLTSDKKIQDRFPDDTEFRKAITEGSITDNKKAKVFLYLLENSIRVSGIAELAGYKHCTLEHIMPNNWQENWHESWIKESSKEDINKKVSNLGNMTILNQGSNSKNCDKIWSEKKPEFERPENNLKLLSKKYIDETEWNADIIDCRAKWLADEAIKVWPDPRSN